MHSKYSLRIAIAATLACAALSAHAGGEVVYAISKVANPHGLAIQDRAAPQQPLHLTAISAAGLIDKPVPAPSTLAFEGLYSFAILRANGDWEAAAYLAAELKDYARGAAAGDAAAVAQADFTLPEHVRPVVYPTHLVDGIADASKREAAVLCRIKAPSLSASTDPRLRAIGLELARQCRYGES